MWLEFGFEWEKVFKLWKVVWFIYVYLFVIVFFIIGVYVGYYVVLNIYDGLGCKYLSVCLNVMVFLFGIMRFFVLFFDFYY